MEDYKVLINEKENTPEDIEQIRKAILENEGFCPCKIEKILANRCMCEDFRNQDTEGPCNCGLYYKIKVKN